jgi:phosphoserine phosphatase RsbX
METMIAQANSSFDCTFVECGVCARPMPGEIESGDLHVLTAFDNGVLIAVIDGLGHGSEAALAAQAAHVAINQCPQMPVDDLLRNCHTALRKTRGAVLSLASFDPEQSQMSWVGVGNVDGTLFRANPATMPQREALQQRGGVVGYNLPSLRVATIPVAPDDVLIFATDGIDGIYRSQSPVGWNPQDFAEHIVRHHGKETDDALVLAIRYRGSCRAR